MWHYPSSPISAGPSDILPSNKNPRVPVLPRVFTLVILLVVPEVAPYTENLSDLKTAAKEKADRDAHDLLKGFGWLIARKITTR